MKDNSKGGIIIVILIIVGAILLYPFKVTIDKNGKTTCSNLLGMKYNCHD